MTDDTFMTVRDIVQEIRGDVKALQERVDRFERNTVTKAEFNEFKKAAVLSAQWRIGTTITLTALVVTVVTLVVSL